MARTDRQIVAAAFRGQLTKPASKLSAAYVRRLANEVRLAKREGRKPQRQAGRGHRKREYGGQLVSTEHPVSRVRRGGEWVRADKAKPAPVRRSPTDRTVAGHAILAERQFESAYAAFRWLHGLGADTPVQAIAFGVLNPEWVLKTGSGIPPKVTQPEDEDEAEEPDEDEPAWRPFYTGNGAGDVDENGQTAATYEEFQASRDWVFEPDTVELYLIRWQA